MHIANKYAPKIGLRSRMLLILALAGIPGIMAAVFLAVLKFSEETSQIETGVARLSTLGAARHEAVLANARTLLEAVARTQELVAITDVNCASYLKNWTERLVSFTSLTLFDTEGTVVCTNFDGELPYIARDRDWFAKAKEGQRFTLSDYTVGRGGAPLLIAASPVFSAAESLIGILAIGISLNWLDFIADGVDLPANGTITALGPDGVILSHNNAAESDELAPPPSPQALQAMNFQGKGTLRAKDQAGTVRVYGFSKTGSGGVTVIVGLPRFVEYSEWGAALVDTLLAPLIVIILALFAAAWASEVYVTRHVRSLIETTQRITGGEYDARSEVDYDEHELGQLAATLDAMAETIETSYDELQQKISNHKLISDELTHRLNNSLALVSAIARQTLRYSDDTTEFETKFTNRLRVLAASNAVLAKGDWRSADAKKLLTEIVSTHYDADSQSLNLEGPEIRLNPRTTMALSLTIHELATNSAKYGALAQDGGLITLRWTISERNGEPWLSFVWRESNGAPGKPDAAEGFGSKLIRRMIIGQLGGRIEQNFTADGLTYTIEFPWRKPSGDTGRRPEGGNEESVTEDTVRRFDPDAC